ncbi:MAG: hypothetical protein VX798_06620 [Bacteroidota bacterium]|nr:hypothetical protein [Bacteroidota bacterium]
MGKLRNPLFAVIFFVIGLIIVSIAYSFLPIDEKTTVNFITVGGTYSSIFGIIIAYIQILTVKRTTELTKEKVEESNKRIAKTLSVSDLSKAIKLVHEIQNYLVAGKVESAIIRLKDLKSILIYLKYNDDLSKLTSTEIYTESLSNVSINMSNLTKELIGQKKGIDKSKIIEDLETIEDQLGEFEGHLKFDFEHGQ